MELDADVLPHCHSRYDQGRQTDRLEGGSCAASACTATQTTRAGVEWDDAVVVSAHGRDPAEALAVVRSQPKVAVLTDAGFQKVVTAAPGHVERVRQLVFDPLDERDLATLDEVMVKMLDILDPDAKFAATALARQT